VLQVAGNCNLRMSHWLRDSAGASSIPRRNVGIFNAIVSREKSARIRKSTTDKGVMRQGLCRISLSCIDAESSLRGSILLEYQMRRKSSIKVTRDTALNQICVFGIGLDTIADYSRKLHNMNRTEESGARRKATRLLLRIRAFIVPCASTLELLELARRA
jgi:hypothetical protein